MTDPTTSTTDPSTSTGSWRRWLRWIGPIAGATLFLFAVWVIQRELSRVSFAEVVREVRATPALRVWMALGLAVLAYLTLTGYDLLAIRYIGKRLSVGKVCLTSFLSYVFSNNIGLSVVGASAIRLRFYTNWGLSVEDVLKVVGFAVTTFWLGILALAGVAFLFTPIALPENWNLPFQSVRPIGAALCALTVGWCVFCAVRRTPYRIRNFELPVPSLPVAVGQVVVGALDWLFAGSILWVFLPASAQVPYGECLAIYLVAQVTALASHVPGGVGVFESIVIVSLKSHAAGEEIVGALLLYRLVYYILPLVIGAILLGAFELRQRLRNAARARARA
jgi:phosphatidylglycerol lysyltransferase